MSNQSIEFSVQFLVQMPGALAWFANAFVNLEVETVMSITPAQHLKEFMGLSLKKCVHPITGRTGKWAYSMIIVLQVSRLNLLFPGSQRLTSYSRCQNFENLPCSTNYCTFC